MPEVIAMKISDLLAGLVPTIVFCVIVGGFLLLLRAIFCGWDGCS